MEQETIISVKRVVKPWVRRACVGFIVGIWILAPYMLLQQFALHSVTWLNETDFDRMVPIVPSAIYVYFSYYLLLLWAGSAVPDANFAKFLRAVCMVTLVSHLTFFFFPTGLARDAMEAIETPALYDWLVSVEKPRNCLPSLHASLATLAALALWSRGKLVGILGALWMVAILWSAIAIRQHILIDLAAGVVLAMVVWLVPALSRKKHPIK